MSNPPFGSPFHSPLEDDFSFPIEPPNDPSSLPLQEQNLSPISSLPMPQDLTMFLDHDDVHQELEDYSLLTQEQYPTNNNWVLNEPLISLDHHDDHDQVQVQQGGGGEGLSSRPPIDHVDDRAVTASHVIIGEGSSSRVKKQDHNAKERVRRLQLNASFLALRSLLPDSKRAKKRWSAPYIIDRALDFIPQLEGEIEKLTLDKTNLLQVVGKQKQVLTISDDQDQESHVNKEDNPNLTVTLSISEVKKGEVIIQICLRREKVDSFSNLVEKLEGEGMQIMGASTLFACEDRSCFHLHVQMGENPLEADYVAVLHKKLISWLS